MRPFLHRLATTAGLAGFVGNDVGGVYCEVEGAREAVDTFVSRLLAEAPTGAVVEDVRSTVVRPTGEEGFRIVDSDGTHGRDGPVALVPPDRATCSDCMAELHDPENRRFRYPFVACAYCGPRFTIVQGVPYDRPYTTMSAFPMCAACQTEYDDPADRRFHAQPIACPACGPRLVWRTPDGRPGGPDAPEGDAALAAAITTLRAGGVVAVKGVGGYHLACDARRPDVVDVLRTRKRRSAKPFALLAADLEVAGGLVELDPTARRLLSSPAAPIVLAPARLDCDAVVAIRDSVAPGQASLGVLLPYSGLHHLLTSRHPALGEERLDLLVLTSGNLANEPLCVDPDEAERRLSGLVDGFLHHDRPIRQACDDSVVRVHATRAASHLAPVRRSRGYAPLPVPLSLPVTPVLAVGGELKATVCLADHRRAWMSQHIGDVGSVESLALLARTVDLLQRQSHVEPEVVAADLHPGYVSTRWARDFAAQQGCRLVQVQHHHAHLAALLAEHGRDPQEQVLGVVFDGTGYGWDASIWGGEFLLGSYSQVERVGRLGDVPLPGGDAAIRHPPRTALAHLFAAGEPWDERLDAVQQLSAQERDLLASMLGSGAACVPTSSMGRLFDAVSSLAGVCQDGGYEGQAAMELEACAWSLGASSSGDPGVYAFPLTGQEPVVVDPAPVVAGVVRDVLSGVGKARVAWRFHEAVARMVVQVADDVRRRRSTGAVGLTGGVFQNAWVTARCRQLLEQHDFDVLVHRQVPANDGGLALGQAVVAAMDPERSG
jgi:hydrogenase maturation protein HypF